MDKHWYVIHTYSGYENKVKMNLEKRVETMGMEDKIFRVLVPEDEETEIKDGKKKVTMKKFFPGYVLAEMIIDRKSTRLNSSHVAISYAVFCLKKKSQKDPDVH